MNTTLSEDEKWMRHCLNLSEQGRGQVAPNPMVGAVLVHQGVVIAQGFHQRYGGAHAEVNALAEIPDGADLKLATLYVNLEPCAHFGKTPPCADLLIKRGVGRVVVGAADLNPKVAGQGIQRLRNAGIVVQVGVLERECIELNRRFYSSMAFHRPYVVLKWAESADRFIGDPTHGRVAISGEAVLPIVHRWRSEEQAIMVGTNTARLDDPALTVRHTLGKNPIRVIIDRKLTLPSALQVFCDKAASTWIINELRDEDRGELRWIKLDFEGKFISSLLARLHAENIQSVLVEGGAKLLQSFIDSSLWDEVRVIRSKKFLGAGVAAPNFPFELLEQQQLGCDTILTARGENYPMLLDMILTSHRSHK